MEVLLEEDDRIKLLNTDAVFNIMQRILLRENEIDRNREHFWVIGLENNNRILFIELVSLGSFIGNEKSYRFEQLVYRLAAEEIVSMSKAASLAGLKLVEFKDKLDAC